MTDNSQRHAEGEMKRVLLRKFENENNGQSVPLSPNKRVYGQVFARIQKACAPAAKTAR